MLNRLKAQEPRQKNPQDLKVLSSEKPPLKKSHYFESFIQIALFLIVFTVLQLLYGWAIDTWNQQLLVDKMTAATSAQFINWITPEVGAKAIGIQLNATGGSINIANGCNGLEVMFLFIAAIAIAPLYWRPKLMGLLIGIPYIFIINQARVLSLFYSFRIDKTLFWSLHDTVTPILLIVFAVLFLAYWLSRYSQYGLSNHA